ncbi:fibronectin type III-like domain-contianing protein [Naasia aerilata]|uniref:Fibronectin type III-like domain-containing protein n=1 Tax=Naasia aerilata TaxID=1162966 RepID=A0ABN6XI06_9MICO|nr:fibronectin type III-like domain-contianing protein [Naasia aerilata]BDZ44474.1 hypothetical protein GCM10025866_03830 [Naasia aerilata]
MTIRVTVRNIGDRTGDDIVQVYVRDLVASIAPAVRRLRGFERVTLEPGEQRTLTFPLSREDLGFWTNSESGEFVVEPGAFTITVTDGTTSRELPLRVT